MAINILNKQFQTANKGRSSHMGTGCKTKKFYTMKLSATLKKWNDSLS